VSVLDRLRRDYGDLLGGLENLSARDLNSLLLHVFAGRSGPEGLLARFERLVAARPMRVDARVLHRAEGLAFAAASAFEAVALPPVLPLGATRALGGTHQNNVLSCLRGLEVMADPTTWLGLEAARRRRECVEVVRLCCSQRVIRMQPLPMKELLPHFQLFALASAGRRDELTWLREHIAVWLDLLSQVQVGPLVVEVADARLVSRALAGAGVPREEVRAQVRAHDLAASRALLGRHGVVLPRGRGLDAGLESVLAALAEDYPRVEMVIDLNRLEGLGYYCGPMLRISAGTEQRMPFVDGGLVDWPGRLLSDRREMMFASGVGLDWLARMAFGHVDQKISRGAGGRRSDEKGRTDVEDLP